jgi:hypothetical protein
VIGIPAPVLVERRPDSDTGCREWSRFPEPSSSLAQWIGRVDGPILDPFGRPDARDCTDGAREDDEP